MQAPHSLDFDAFPLAFVLSLIQAACNLGKNSSHRNACWPKLDACGASLCLPGRHLLSELMRNMSVLSLLYKHASQINMLPASRAWFAQALLSQVHWLRRT